MKQEEKKLRYGWTTGACATAATKGAFAAIKKGFFPDSVQITLPRGQKVPFILHRKELISNQSAVASVIKDAGDDPDVTHGAEIISTVKLIGHGQGIIFKAGKGVGTVTKAGLPLKIGEPAINPVPRSMMIDALKEIVPYPDVEITLSIPRGEILAQKTMNPRLGIRGGLSILGTTGIVVPFSCAAWIASIHRGIDVARAANIDHVVASVGDVSEKATQLRYDLPESAYIEMGDFAGGLIRYIKTHPVQTLTISGGVAKMTKLAQKNIDLHSKRSSVDTQVIIEWLQELGSSKRLINQVSNANTTLEIFTLCQAAEINLGDFVANKALLFVKDLLAPISIQLEILLFDRLGKCQGRACS